MKITALKTWQVPPRWLFLKIETDAGVYGWGEPVVDKSALKIDDGFIAIPQGPGLGVEIDEAYVEERSKVGHRWRNPVWTHEDGSIAEW